MSLTSTPPPRPHPPRPTITLGQSNTDSATVTGNPSLGPPTGTVTFYVCGPTATPTACTSQSEPGGKFRGLDRGGRRHLECHVGPPSLRPTTGYWCFAGYYSGDSNYNAEL